MYVLDISADLPFAMTSQGWHRSRTRVFTGAHTAMAKHWHEHMLPRHFKPGAAARYGYQERMESTIRAKAGRWGKSPEYAKQYPLTMTGDLSSDVTGAFVVRATPTKFSVRMQAPHYATMRPKSAGMPNLGAEITTVTLDEIRELEEIGRKEAYRLFEIELRKKAKWLFK